MNKITLRFFKDFVFRYWKKELLIFLAMMLETAVSLSFPLINQTFIDYVLIGKNVKYFYVLWAGMMAVVLLQPILAMVKDILFFNIGENILKDVRLKLINHILFLSPAFTSKMTVGEFLSRADRDVEELQEVSSSVMLDLIGSLISVIFVCGIMIKMNSKLAILSFLITTAYIFCYNFFGKKVKEKSREQLETISQAMGFMSEIFLNLSTIQLFNREEWAHTKMKGLYQDQYDKSFKLNVLYTINGNIAFVVAVFGMGILWLVGGKAILNHKMTIGSVIAFSSYQNKLFSPLRLFAGVNTQIQSAIAAMERIYEILTEEPYEKSDRNLKMEQFKNGDIEFKGVSFSYCEGDMILKDITFSIKSGEIVAFVGQSGCGKSTILKLLTKLYNPNTGQILINGKDIAEYSAENLREHISVIEQDDNLFNMSIYENIVLGDLAATRERIDETIRMVDMDEYINSLPEGYDFLLKESGNNLSGGQRKRISIARSLIKEAKIFILDEATNSLDVKRRKKIMSLIKQNHNDSTFIIVTHNMDEVCDVDRLYVMEDGKIVCEGKHEDLLTVSKTYSNLC